MVSFGSVVFLAAATAATIPRCALATADQSTPLYKNPSEKIEDRVNDLLGRMTIQEKVAQMLVRYFTTLFDGFDLCLGQHPRRP